MPFYRYQPINKLTLSNLTKRKNWVADPSTFNDPFEFRIQDNITLNKDGSVQLLNDKLNKVRDEIIKQTKEFGVVSYTTNESDTLMWSHYADNHRGMCLVFDIPNPLSVGMHMVKYFEGIPEMDFDVKDGKLKKEKVREIIKLIISSKSDKWKPENEFRQVFTYNNRHADYPGPLKEIIFGCQSSKDDIEMVISIMNEDLAGIDISKMFISKNSYNLGKDTISLQHMTNKGIPEFWDGKYEA